MLKFFTKISLTVCKIFLVFLVGVCIVFKLLNNEKPKVNLTDSNNKTATSPLILLWNGYQEHDELWSRVFHRMTSGIVSGHDFHK